MSSSVISSIVLLVFIYKLRKLFLMKLVSTRKRMGTVALYTVLQYHHSSLYMCNDSVPFTNPIHNNQPYIINQSIIHRSQWRTVPDDANSFLYMLARQEYKSVTLSGTHWPPSTASPPAVSSVTLNPMTPRLARFSPNRRLTNTFLGPLYLILSPRSLVIACAHGSIVVLTLACSDEIRCGPYRRLFHPELLINGYQDASNNFARGYLAEAKLMIHALVDKTRHMIENCDNFSGFLVQSGTAGGTGSGLLSALMEHLLTEFAGRTTVQLSILPGQKLSNCIVQPYNCVLSAEKLIYCSDLNIIVNNEMLYSISYNQLDIERPTFANINQIIAPIIQGLTAPIRFQGMINSDLKEISTNLVPYPSLHFPMVSYAPLTSIEKLDHDLLNNESLTRSLFHHDNQFIDVNLTKGFFLSSALLYRGNCDLSAILKTVQAIKIEKDFHWVDWCPTAFKISHTIERTITASSIYDKTAMMISNHSGISSTLSSMEKKFNILFRKKAYLHWYIGEGMEESEFHNAIDEVNTISLDYSNITDRISGDMAYSKNPSATTPTKNTHEVFDSPSKKHVDILPGKETETNSDREKLKEMKEVTDSKETNTEESLPPYAYPHHTGNKFGIQLSSPYKQERLSSWASMHKNSEQRNSEDSRVSNSHNVSNKIYEICARSYLSGSSKILTNKKRILRQTSSFKDENIIKKVYRRQKDLFNHFVNHSQKYTMTTFQIK